MSRRELQRHEQFDDVSPEVGELDEDAFDQAMADDPDAAMALLADLTGATDQRLRELARRLAGRVVVDLSRRGPTRPRGVGKLRLQRFEDGAGDLDVDASIDAVAVAAAHGGAPDLDELRARAWHRPGTALCLLVDRSGSMGGERLATAAVAAAAVAWRAPEDYSVIAFGKDAVVAKSQDVPRGAEVVVNDLLALRGFGTTDVAGALRVASLQLQRSRAGRKIAILLSDCRATVDGDVAAAARALDELFVVAPAADSAEAEALAASVGALCVTVRGPSDLPAALSRLLPS